MPIVSLGKRIRSCFGGGRHCKIFDEGFFSSFEFYVQIMHETERYEMSFFSII